MSKRMLIDASHPEETRVVTIAGNRVDEFDFESASRKPLKGNIYLAKVTRVEPSLQAAFVEYGGNRHGFLAFSEIHPDYYQIPYADRQALLAAAAEEERQSRKSRRVDEAEAATKPSAPADAPEGAVGPDAGDVADPLPSFDVALDDAAGQLTASDFSAAADEAEAPSSGNGGDDADDDAPRASAETANGDASDSESGGVQEIVAEPVEAELVSAGDDDAMEEVETRRPSSRLMRNYKIQEVIKKRQVLLIQVVKEERGNKGAALTTYLSLAGRYCVLMPNSGRGGGISRKITNAADRRRLKDAAESLEVPDGMGLIVRTAGASRTKQEIQRDYEYLLRLWDSIRELTLRSSAPALVYEEGNLIKRAIRDQFSRDIEEIVVQGERGYREALGFMRMIMPQHAAAVKLHDGRPPLFHKHRVEQQLDSMFNPRVQLKSGGYIIINQTEALVAIDVNSGRSTREHNIEDTALKTNLEAAEEAARQLRLRDLAGLIVIDFIDMEENRNNRAVERRLKECLRHDRARIQLGRISPFGLLEMSRQRLRPGVVEGSTVACPHCNGTGLIRSVESLALRALRMVEEEMASDGDGATVRVPVEVALYVLNHKRPELTAIEERLGAPIYVEGRPGMLGADCEIELGVPAGYRAVRSLETTAVAPETALAMLDPYEPEPEPEPETAAEETEAEREDGEGRRDGEARRGRRRRRRGRDRDRDEAPAAASSADPLPTVEIEGDSEGEDAADDAIAHTGGEPSGLARDADAARRRRRGRRGGRRNRRDGFEPLPPVPVDAVAPGDDAPEREAEALAPESDDADLPPSRFDPIAPRPSAPAPAPKPAEKASTAAAIARFFGFGPKKADAEADAAASPAAAEAAPTDASAPALATEPTAEAPEAAPVVEASEPAPSVEAAAPVPEPAVPDQAAAETPVEIPAPAAIQPPPPAPEPAEPELVAEPWPDPPAGSRKGWWKKREG